jgi:hypothetical protein
MDGDRGEWAGPGPFTSEHLDLALQFQRGYRSRHGHDPSWAEAERYARDQLARQTAPARYARQPAPDPDSFDRWHLQVAERYLKRHHVALQKMSAEDAWAAAAQYARGVAPALARARYAKAQAGDDPDGDPWVKKLPDDAFGATQPVPYGGDEFTEAHLGAATRYLEEHYSELKGLPWEEAWKKAKAWAKKVVKTKAPLR